jgi:hypothetical protein
MLISFLVSEIQSRERKNQNIPAAVKTHTAHMSLFFWVRWVIRFDSACP